MPKKLVIITGPAGVGKSTMVRELLRMIDGCAWLDADWCWMLNPWHSPSAEQREDMLSAYGHILTTYFCDAHTHTVLFSWVMRDPMLFRTVRDIVQCEDIHVMPIVLVCDPKEHQRRLVLDRRSEASVNRHEDMAVFLQLGAWTLDTTNLSPAQTARQVFDYIQSV